MKILYLGLRAKPGMVHYPVIRTAPLEIPKIPILVWNGFTHIIFTSQSAVGYWPGPWDKEIIAIGEGTASVLREKGLAPLIAPTATQEGIVELIKGMQGSFFIPRSKRARSVLTDDLKIRGVPFLAIDLYDTEFQKLEPVPNLDDFEEIVFTSPSTVEGFLQIFQKLPGDKKLTAIGPVTEQALARQLFLAKLQTLKSRP